jgi:non-heme Fe2+,alpha-ketoglutarate-dependent halogenase
MSVATSEPTAANPLKRLTPADVERYRTDGAIMPFRIFNDAEVQRNLRELDRLMGMLKPGQTAGDINCWERFDPFVFSLAAHPVILDYVEDIIGPNIMLWSTHMFCKLPGDGKDVAWHQDAYYWPLQPHRNVTVWLAFDDSDEGNGGMNIIPGTHRIGSIDHEEDKHPGHILFLKIKEGLIDESKAVCLRLKAGEISLHDDNVVHGSKANKSTRRRAGLTMRYVTPDVKCDLKVWPGFQTCLMRGVDTCDLNPHFSPPASS